MVDRKRSGRTGRIKDDWIRTRRTCRGQGGLDENEED